MPSCVIAGYDASHLPPVTALLERYGCKVYIVATAREALRLCQTHKIDLLISRVVFAEEGRMNGAYFDPLGANDTNRDDIFVFGNEENIMLVSRLDNLGKGASGNAVQNMNLMLGFDEATALAA